MTYQKHINKKWHSLKERGYEYSVFGDIFLEDIKNFRLNQLWSVGLIGLFPL